MAGERWRNFFNFSTIDNNRINGLCKLCNQNYKDKNGIFSNFFKHLKRKHSREYQEIFPAKDQLISDDLSVEKDDPAPGNLPAATSKQNLINVAIGKHLIIRCNMPLNLVENSSFRDFIKECGVKWNPISSKKLKNEIISSLAEKLNNTIYETLADVHHLTITLDGWTDRRSRAFLGFTCHYINQKMEPKSLLLDFVRLKSPHTGENIQETTECTFDRFNIKEKVYKIITDNASSMVKAFKFGLSSDEEQIVGEDDSRDTKDTNASIDDDDFDVNNFRPMAVDLGEEMDQDDSSTFRLSCFVHTLQLSVRDGLKNAPYVSKLLGKCQALSTYSHKSTKMADLMEQLNKHITKMNVTRWNSEFLLMKSIQSVGKNDLNLIASLSDKPIKFSNNDFIVLDEIIDILDPFNEITVKCQAEKVVTASLVVPSIVHLLSHLRDVKENLHFCSKLSQELQTSFKIRFVGIVNRLNLVDVTTNDNYADPLYFITTVLDPSFKFFWLRDLQLPVVMENRLKQNIIEMIVSEINKDSFSSGHNAEDSNVSMSSSASSSSTPKTKRRKLFIYDENSIERSSDLRQLDPSVEVDAYLNDPIRTEFSEYWYRSHLSLLKKLVSKIFTVQATSAAIERVFSQAGLVLSSKRTKMNERLFRELVFLRVNHNLLP